MNTHIIGKWHKISALVLTVFILLHLTNHLIAYLGPEAHINVMSALRTVYRSWIGETILLLAVLGQIITGIIKVRKWGLKQKNFFDRLQVYSGLYLVFFLFAHTTAVLVARNVIGLDTNFYFGASALYLWPFKLFFVPYYTLSILAFFAHTGCVLRWILMNSWGEKKSNQLVYILMGIGLLISVLLVFVFSGLVYEIELSPEIRAWFPQ